MGEARRRQARASDPLGEAILEALGPAGRKMLTVEAMDIEAALARPRLAGRTEEAFRAALAVAAGTRRGPMGECFGCRSAWTHDRMPLGVLVTTIATAGRPPVVLLSLLCRGCAALPLAEQRRLV